MKYIICVLLLVSVSRSYSQEIPPKANVIIVKGLTLNEALDKMLDKGYTIETKDNDLKTARTDAIVYPRYYNGAYKIQVREKDSAVHFSGVYQCPYETAFTSILLKQQIQKGNWEKVLNRTNKKGAPQMKSMDGYPFHLILDFAKTFNKEIEYKVN